MQYTMNELPLGRRGSMSLKPPRHFQQNPSGDFHHQKFPHQKHSPKSYNRSHPNPVPRQYYSSPYSVSTCKELMFCPNCKRTYDSAQRTPLVMQCNHTVCENCVKNSAAEKKGSVTCKQCSHVTIVNGTLDEVFSVNFYLLGQIYYSRNNLAQCKEFQQLAFSPAGSQIRMPTKSGNSKAFPLKTFQDCSVQHCTRKSKYFCSDCKQNYCSVCKEKLHKDKKHKIFQLEMEECPKHDPQIEDIICHDCNCNCCSYCALDDHRNHSFSTMASLIQQDETELKDLLNQTEDLQRTLMRTKSVVEVKLAQIAPKGTSSALETSIGKCFIDLHAHLQHIEKSLLREAFAAANEDLAILASINEHLQMTISNLQQITEAAKVLVRGKRHKKLNMRFIMEQLRAFRETPCFLAKIANPSMVNKPTFQFDEISEELETHFKIEKDNSYESYKLYYSNPPIGYVDAGDVDAASLEKFERNSSSCDSLTTKTSNSPAKPVGLRSPNYRSPKLLHRSDSQDSTDYKDFFEKSPPIPLITNGYRNNAVISHINSPNSFYVHLHPLYKYFDEMHSHLQSLASQSEVLKNIEIGEICLVKDAMDPGNYWKRGCITEASDSRITLQLIDYGNTINARPKDVKVAPEYVQRIPPLAFECSLYDLRPANGTWDPKDSAKFSKMVEGCDITIVITNADCHIWEVDLIAFNIDCQFSVSASILCHKNGVKPNWEETDNYVVVNPSSPESEKSDYFDFDNMVSEQCTYKVVMTHVDGPFTIYVRLQNLEEAFEKLSAELNAYFLSHQNNGVQYIGVNTPVAIEYDFDVEEIVMLWYRGLVTEISLDTALVHLVDVGITVSVSLDKLIMLPSKFLKSAKMALKVRLADVCSDKADNHSAEAYLKTFVHNQTILEMEVISKEEIPFVVLKTSTQSKVISINAYMVDLNHLTSTGHWSSISEWPLEEDNQAQVNEEDFSDSEDDDEEIFTDACPIEVIRCKDPFNIYVHFIEDEGMMTQLNHLHNSIQKYFSQHTLGLISPIIVDECYAAYDKVSRQFYRVVVEKRYENTEEYDLFCMDHGKILSKVHHEYIGILDDSLKVQPMFAFKANMFGIKPMGEKWSLSACDFLNDILVKKKNILICKVHESYVFWKRHYKAGTALKKSTVKNYNINKLLWRKGLALISKSDWANFEREFKNPLLSPIVPEPVTHPLTIPIPNSEQICDGRNMEWLPSSPITKDVLSATVTYVDMDCNIYFHEVKQNSLLDIISDTLSNKVKPSSLSFDEWKVGNACSVKYHLNERWYRGEVVGIEPHSRQLRVKMIDYGNVEDVSIDEVSHEVMHANIPMLSKMVKLANVNFSKAKNLNAVLDMLHTVAVGKDVSITIINKGRRGKVLHAYINRGTLNINSVMEREIMLDYEKE